MSTMVLRQMNLFGTPPRITRDELYILISGMQKEIRRGHTQEAREVVARILTDKQERVRVFRRLTVILFEDVASTAPKTEEMCHLVMEGSGGNLLKLTALLAESPKSRACDDLVWAALELDRGVKVERLADLGDLLDVDRLLRISRGMCDLYTADRERYFKVFHELLSEVEKAAIQRANSMGATHALLHPLAKLLPPEERYYPDFEPPVLLFGGLRSYWVDQHTRLGKKVIATLAQEKAVDKTLLAETIFLGEGALVNPPRIGWDYGVRLFGDRYGKTFDNLMGDRSLWDRLNELRAYFLRTKFSLRDEPPGQVPAL